MIKFRNLLTSVGFLLVAQMADAEALQVSITPEGGVGHIVIAGDSTNMDWVLQTDGSQYERIGRECQWGLGSAKINGERFEWTHGKIMGKSAGTMLKKAMKVEYAIGNAVRLTVERSLNGDDVAESYTFTNVSKKVLGLSEIEINTPFCDNYPQGGLLNDSRCHAHVWAAGTESYVCAMRKSAMGPHLGLMLREGALEGYSIREQGASNMRGVLCLSPEAQVLQPGKSYTVAWRLFTHGGRDDFYAQLMKRGGVQVIAERYVAQVGEQVSMLICSNNDDKMGTKNYFVRQTGDIRVPIHCNGGYTWVELYGMKSYGEILANRARYVLGNGGEKLSMQSALFLAYMCQKTEDQKLKDEIKNVLARRSEILHNDMLAKDLDGTLMAARLWLEMAYVAKDYKYLDWAYEALKDAASRIAVEGGEASWVIGVPLVECLDQLETAGHEEQYDALLAAYAEMAEGYLSDDETALAEERTLTYAQLCGRVRLLEELFLVTTEEKYLDVLERLMPVLEAYSGQQPSYNLNDIAVSYGGKEVAKGDLMPYYRSCLAADCLALYGMCTGNGEYMDRARGILRSNLCLFADSGKAGGAYIYPSRVNGKMRKGLDIYASCDDSALMYYLKWMK